MSISLNINILAEIRFKNHLDFHEYERGYKISLAAVFLHGNVPIGIAVAI